jgi:hypothetical protein
LEKEFRLGVGFATGQECPFLVEDAQVYFVGAQIDSAVLLVLFGVQSHEQASFVCNLLLIPLWRQSAGGVKGASKLSSQST